MFRSVSLVVSVCLITVAASGCATPSLSADEPAGATDAQKAQAEQADHEEKVARLDAPTGTAHDAQVREVEAEFQRYMDEAVLAADATSVATKEALSQVERKLAKMAPLRARYMKLAQQGDPAIRSYSAVRLGQIYLDVGCEMLSLQPPASFREKERAVFREQLDRTATPIVGKSKELFDGALSSTVNGEQPQVSAVVEAIAGAWKPVRGDDAATHARANCEATRAYWFNGVESTLAKFQNRCSEGDGEACLAVANSGKVADDEQVALVEKACELASADACEQRARDLLEQGGAKSEAIGYFERACEAGDDRSCISARVIVEVDKADAYAKACGEGDALACLRRASLADGSDEASSLTKTCAASPIAGVAASEASKGCRKGDGAACLVRASQLLADKALDFGTSTPVEPMMLVALQGSGLRTGTDEKADLEAAAKACEEGDGAKCVRASRLTRNQGKEPKKEWLVQGCTGELTSTCVQLAETMIAEGGDMTKAATALDKACRDGKSNACRGLARKFASGEHFPKSRACAAGYLWELCSPEDPQACAWLNEILAPQNAAESETKATTKAAEEDAD